MKLDDRLTRAAHHVADRVSVPEVDLAAVRSRARANRRRDLAVAVGAALVAVTVVGTALVGGRTAERTAPADPPTPGPTPHGAVWYDRDGLHHGNLVDKAAVDLDPRRNPSAAAGVLALVRGGAVYRDPTGDDVWFHPWDGEPHIIGHAVTGPGGDPESDVAAWFEGDELVVYDTALAQEISRTTEEPIVAMGGFEHAKDGNGFLHVSAEEVVWRFQDESTRARDARGAGVYRLDLATGVSTMIAESPLSQDGVRFGVTFLEDVHDDIRVLVSMDDGYGMTVETSNGPPLELPGLEDIGRLSPDGSFMLSPSNHHRGHGIAIIDMRSGERWNVLGEKQESYGWISWSYDNLAVIEVHDDLGTPARLLACEAATRSCEELTFRGRPVLPAP
jgi:hypothetical protein